MCAIDIALAILGLFVCSLSIFIPIFNSLQGLEDCIETGIFSGFVVDVETPKA